MGLAKQEGTLVGGLPKMRACFVAVVTIAGLAGMLGEAVAQTYPPYAPPGSYRGPPVQDDDDDIVALPAPGPYGRPSGVPGAIQRETLPPPPGVAAPPYPGDRAAAPPPPPAGGPRGYTYGPWEAVRPPGDLYGSNGYGSNGLPPGPGGGRPEDYGVTTRPPMDIAPGGYGALPPDYQPERGKPKELPAQFRRQVVDYPSKEKAGTIIIDTPSTYLYLVLGNGKALRYGIGVGREGFTWAGREKISKMAEWPDWTPPKEMIDRQPYLPRFMAGGESNPLGARALYLGSTVYRIHGTNQPSTIGTFVSSGCIRLTNGDVEDLYGRVTVGTRVVVLPGKQPSETTASVR
jgi:lipoprotein-anchoring transpeptidase ErfK/SrfK